MNSEAWIDEECPTPIQWTTTRAYILRRTKDQDSRIAELERDLAAAHARIERLREALRSLEWAGDADGDEPDSYCVHCMAFEDEGHSAGCAYAVTMHDLGEPPAAAKETP